MVVPCSLLAATAGYGLMMGCPSQRMLAERGAHVGTEGRFVPTDAPSGEISATDLMREALAGVAAAPDGSLGSRLALRPIGMPHPPRGATAKFNFDDGKRGWITALPNQELLTSPAFYSGKVFLGGGFASHRFFALDAYDGGLTWTLAAPDGGPTAAVIHRDRVIFNTESCTLFVADAATGALAWSRWLGDPLMSQPVAAEELVMSAYPADGSHRFGAFALADGAPVWDVAIAADVIQAPQVQGDSVYFATMDGAVERRRVRDGHLIWRREAKATSAVWVDGDHVLLTQRVDGGGAISERSAVLSAADGRVTARGESVAAPYLAGDSRDRQLASGQAGAWGGVPHGEHLGLRNVAAGWAFQGATPAVADGRAYFAVGGDIRATDMATGAEVWRRTYAQAEGAQALSPPAVVGAQLLFGTVDGHLYAVDIDTGMTLWAYDLGEPVVFQPIVAQGWVYVGTGQGNVVGLEMGDPMFDGWHMWGGNAQHAGAVAEAGAVDPALLASLTRPTRGSMTRMGFMPDEEAEVDEGQEATDAPSPDGVSPDEEVAAAAETAPELPLVRTRVEAQVSGIVSRVTITQTFENPSDKAIEALYVFPLPANAAVDDMQMRIGRRLVRGRIQRRAQARQTYEEARGRGQRAALLEQQRPNLFAQRVANLQPGEPIEVRIQYVELLPFEDGDYEMVFPLTAPRRFDPGDPSALVAADRAVRRAEAIEISVDVDAGLPIETMTSPSHEVQIERVSANRRKVVVAAGRAGTDRDFVLRYGISGQAPRAVVMAHRDGEEQGHFTLLVQPPAAPDASEVTPRDVAFVVDTSSSMRGRPMAHAQAIIDAVLDDLGPEDRFNVFAFNDTVQAMAEQGAAPNAETLRQGRAFLAGLAARGSTDMVPAITAALARRPGDGVRRLPIVVLITDGFIGNEAEVLRAIAANLGSTRLFGVGVGSAVNRFLLERASEIGRGRSLVVTLSEDARGAGERFAALIDRPVFTDVEVDFGDLAVSDLYPRRLPDLFASQPLVIRGRYARGGRAEVKVRGTVAGRRYERVIDVDLPARSSDARHAVQATLWARAAIHDRMNRVYLRDDPALVEEITEIGLAHRIVTRFTSFVAVDQEVVEANDGADVDGQASVSPSRILPGDPEIRIPAPADARAVTVVLPFGETVAATYEHRLGMWTARFLIPMDAAEGNHPIDVLITHSDGRPERLRLWFTVDESAPLVELEVVGQARPGGEVLVRARQVLTQADLSIAGVTAGSDISAARAQLLSDARRVEVHVGADRSIALETVEPGVWEGRLPIASNAVGTTTFDVVVIDVAANVRHQRLTVEVTP